MDTNEVHDYAVYLILKKTPIDSNIQFKKKLVSLTSTKLFVIKCLYFCMIFSSEINFMTVSSSTTMPHFDSGQLIEPMSSPSNILNVKYWRQHSIQYSWPQPIPTISWNGDNCLRRNRFLLYYLSNIFINGFNTSPQQQQYFIWFSTKWTFSTSVNKI